jgi:hypothetical protein
MKGLKQAGGSVQKTLSVSDAGCFTVQSSVTLAENNMITPGHTDDVAILYCIHYFYRVSAGVRIIRLPTKTTMTPNTALADH